MNKYKAKKKLRKKVMLFFAAAAFHLLFSCVKPTQETEEKNILTLIDEHLSFMNTIKDDEKKIKKFFTELAENFELIISFYRDSKIVITSSAASPAPGDLSYSLDENKFMVNRPVYITADGKDMLFSLDNKTWYSSKNDARKDLEGVYNDYNFTTKKNDNTIEIDYSMRFSMGRNPKIVKLKKGREVGRLEKGMIFSHKEKEKVNFDLEKKILLIPENTLIQGNLFIEGNLFTCRQDKKSITITSMQNIFIYVKNMMMSLSFDKKDWDVSIFSFEVEPVFNVRAVGDREIYFNVYAHAVYNEEYKSTSIVKLLVDLM